MSFFQTAKQGPRGNAGFLTTHFIALSLLWVVGMPAFKQDATASALVRQGEHPETSGLLAVVGWGWAADYSSSCSNEKEKDGQPSAQDQYATFLAGLEALGARTRHHQRSQWNDDRESAPSGAPSSSDGSKARDGGEEDRAGNATPPPPSLFLMQAPHLHVTVATLSSFTDTSSPFFYLGPEGKKRVVEAWGQALEAALERRKEREGAIFPFELTINAPILTSSAGVFLLEDHGQNLEALRKCVREAAQDPIIEELSDELLREEKSKRQDARSGGVPGAVIKPLHALLKVPNIVHSTCFRFAAPVENCEAFERDFIELSARWRPVRIHVSAVQMVQEYQPYMQVSRERGEVWCFPPAARGT